MNPAPASNETIAVPPVVVSSTTSRRVVLVRGDAFVVRRFDLPGGASPQEVASFVALQLEELSPFPLDQLYHGHAVASDRRSVLIYAAYRRRFPAEQTEHWSEADFVLPEFAAALRLKFPATTVVFLRTAYTLSALYYDADRELPARMVSRPLALDALPDAVEGVRQAVRLLVAAGASTREVAFWISEPPTLRAKGLQFFLEPDGPGVSREIFIPGSECWTMDVRDPDFIANQRKRQGVDLVLWRVVLGAAAAIALLVFGEILLGASKGYASWLERRNNTRAPEVATLQNREIEANQLEDFGRSGVKPFDMLNVVATARITPDGRRLVTFTRATAKGSVVLEVEGNAPDVASINAYEAALRAVPTIKDVEVRPERGGAGGTPFKISITFQSTEFSPGTVAVGQGGPP